MKKLSALSVCLILSLMLSAQKKETKDYGKMKAEVDEKVFGTPDPAFKDNTIPDQYKNESAIIIAQKYSLESDSKFKFRFMKMSGTSYNFYDIYRKKILINDRAALDEYSQLNFTKLQARSRRIFYYKNYTFINIRLIKPNGTIKNIDVEESAITLKDEKNEKQNKIAIPDLAVGDIIDYYVCSYYEDQSVSSKSLSFVLADDYPTLNFVVSLQFDARIGVEYQTINGAPDFKISPDQQGGGNVLFLAVKNVPKIKGLLWSSAERQLPIIRLNYSRQYITRPDMPVIKTGDVVKSNSNYTKLMEDGMANYLNYHLDFSRGYYKDLNSDIKNAWKAYIAKFPKANSPDSIPSFVFRYAKWKDFYSDFSLETSYQASYFPQELDNQLTRICKFAHVVQGEFDQDLDFIVVSGKNSYTRENLFDVSDLSILLRTRGAKPQYFSFADNLQSANYLPQEFEGEKAMSYPLKVGSSVEALKKESKTITLPSSDYSANVEAETTIVRMDASDPQLLHFNRNVRSTGHLKRNNQANLAVFQDIESQAGCSIGETKDLITRNREKGKGAKKGEEELKTLLEKAKTSQKESFENEIKQVCDVTPKEIKSFGIKNVGLEANAPFEYEEEFVIEGWVKKAGNNYIVDIGKFIVTQIAIDKDQRERTKDIYMPFARNFTYHIEFTAPDGYSIEGLDKLNSTTENKTGAFISTAKMEGNKLIVDINKYYTHAFEPAANWPLILSFLDKALEFNQQKILLKKK